jgi:membrane fusion protein, multidrug efflux system
MKLIIKIIFFLGLVAALAFAKMKYFPSLSSASAPPPSAAPSGKVTPMGVMGYVVKAEVLDNKIFATGTLMAAEMVELRPEISGKVTEMNIQEGRPVTKGQLLLRLNDADLQANLRKFKAQEKIAASAEKRLKALLRVKGISQDEYDIAENQLNNTQAEIELVQAQIKKTELRAPFSGELGLRQVSLGSYITPQNSVGTIQVLGTVKIDFTIPEKYANEVQIGSGISFQAQGLTEVFEGKVFATDNQIEPTTRTLKVRAQAPNKGGKLKPGGFVKVNLKLKNTENALLVPTEAIVPILKGQQVYLIKNGLAVPTKIEIGLRTDAKVQVTLGVQAGDTVLISGLMGLKPQSPVRVTNFN